MPLQNLFQSLERREAGPHYQTTSLRGLQIQKPHRRWDSNKRQRRATLFILRQHEIITSKHYQNITAGINLPMPMIQLSAKLANT